MSPSNITLTARNAPSLGGDFWQAWATQQAQKYLLIGMGFVISAVLGAVIATVWDLNGKIYESVGRIKYAEEQLEKSQINSMQEHIQLLEAEILQLKTKSQKARVK